MNKSEQPSLFDEEGAKEARDTAITQVATNNTNGRLRFELCARAVIRLRAPFTTDDVLQRYPDLEAIREKRVFGAVMLQLCREGIITQGGYRESSRKTSHARPKRIWIPK